MPTLPKTYRFALRLRPAQEHSLARWAGQGRWLWNAALEEQQRRHAAGEPFASFPAMCKWLTALRSAEATAWLATGSVSAQQQVLKQLDTAFKRFFESVKAGRPVGYPRFKKRGRNPALRFPAPKEFQYDPENGRIRIPKVGWCRLRHSRTVPGPVRNISVYFDDGRWHASLQIEAQAPAPAADPIPTIGIDLGTSYFAATVDTTDGEQLIPGAKAFAKHAARLRHYSRQLRRRIKGSANWGKSAKKVASINARIARVRRDWLHKCSADIVSRHPVVAIEDLRVPNMVSAATGDPRDPGRVARKRALNHLILDAGWGEFRRQLEYKTAGVGGQVVAVHAHYTSQTCSCCGHVDPASRLTRDMFTCVLCGVSRQADLNAARNILTRARLVARERQSAVGHTASACGGDIRRKAAEKRLRAAPVKQEPFEALVRRVPP